MWLKLMAAWRGFQCFRNFEYDFVAARRMRVASRFSTSYEILGETPTAATTRFAYFLLSCSRAPPRHLLREKRGIKADARIGRS
jgi:hypothetical protein